VDVFVLPILTIVLRQRLVPRFRHILAGSILVVTSHTVTIAEGFLFPAFFDAVEHLSLAAAGIVFLSGFILHVRDEAGVKSPRR
jgi:hypothetical protein